MDRPVTLYSADLGDREPIAAMKATSERIRALTEAWSDARWERRSAPGKWTARQILTHLAQTELALGTRVRMALVTSNYVAQDFSQDEWLAREADVSGQDALATFLAVGRMNRALFATLSGRDRATPLTHPEYGALTVDWVIHQMAGHQIHHLRQLEQLASTT